MGSGRIDKIDRVLVACVGIRSSAYGLEALGDLGFRELGSRPSRDHMLQVVGKPPSSVFAFIDGSGFHKDLTGNYL